MERWKEKKIIYNTFADFWNGMATAWAFACYDAITRFAIGDLIIAFSLAILSLRIAIGIKLYVAKHYD